MPPNWGRHLRRLRLIDTGHSPNGAPVFAPDLIAFDDDPTRPDVELRRLTISTGVPVIATVRLPAQDVTVTDRCAHLWGRPALTPAVRPIRWFSDDGLLLNPALGLVDRPAQAATAEVDVYVAAVTTSSPDRT